MKVEINSGRIDKLEQAVYRYYGDHPSTAEAVGSTADSLLGTPLAEFIGYDPLNQIFIDQSFLAGDTEPPQPPPEDTDKGTEDQ